MVLRCEPAGVPVENTIAVPATGETPNIAVSIAVPFFYISYAEAPVLVSFNDGPFIYMDQGHGGRMDVKYVRFKSTTGGEYSIRYIVTRRRYQIPFNVGGAGEWVLLAKVSHRSGDSGVVLRHFKNPSDFSIYIWLLHDFETSFLAPSIDFEMIVSQNRGSQYYTVNDHRWATKAVSSDGTSAIAGAINSNAIRIGGPLRNVQPTVARIFMPNPGSDKTKNVNIMWSRPAMPPSFPNQASSIVKGRFNFPFPINGVKYRTDNDSENLTGGYVEWWAIRK